MMGVKEFITFDESKNQYIIPVVKLGRQKRWSAVIVHHENRLKDITYYRKQLAVYPELTDVLKKLDT